MKIVHIAWLGQKNYGDDVMAWAVRDYLEKEFPGSEYFVWCDGRPAESKNVKWIYPVWATSFSFLKRFFEKRALKKADLLLIGGGSILHSEYSIAWKQEAIDYLRAKNPRAKAIGINLSTGPFKSDKAREACGRFLASLDAASFRDQDSFNFAKNHKLPYQPIGAFDLAASFLNHSGLSFNQPQKIRTVGVSLMPGNEEKDRELLKKIKEQFEQVVLFSLCSGADIFGERSYLEKLDRDLGGAFEIVSYEGDPKKFTQQIERCDFFVATRLHSMIVAFLLKIPFIAFAYHQKCSSILKQIRLPEEYIFDPAAYDPDEVLSKIEYYDIPPSHGFLKLSEENFKVFDVLK